MSEQIIRAGWDNDPGTLERLDRTDEIRIETRMSANSPTHRRIIWVVVADGEVYVRSVRGHNGQWYREITANPDGAVLLDSERIPVRAEAVRDRETIEHVSELFRSKYEQRYPGPTEAMLREEVLDTTLLLRRSA